jgi:hypothetical protein
VKTEEPTVAKHLKKRKIMIYWFTVGVRVQLTYSRKEKVKDTTPVYSIHIRALLPRMSLIRRYLMGSEMKFWEFSQFRETHLPVYSFFITFLFTAHGTDKK